MIAVISKLLQFFLPCMLLLNSVSDRHPFFVSVTELEYNNTEKTVEISCKLFTDDLEKTLRTQYPGKIDLLNPQKKTEMISILDAYIRKNLKLTINGKPVTMNYLGYEQQQEAIISYLELPQAEPVKKISLENTLLYTLHPQQMGIVHCIVSGNRKSSRLLNPESHLEFTF